MTWTVVVPDIVAGLFLGAFLALVAVGYSMVYGILRLINFAHGDFYMVAAFVSYSLLAAVTVGTKINWGNVVWVGIVTMIAGRAARVSTLSSQVMVSGRWSSSPRPTRWPATWRRREGAPLLWPAAGAPEATGGPTWFGFRPVIPHTSLAIPSSVNPPRRSTQVRFDRNKGNSG